MQYNLEMSPADTSLMQQKKDVPTARTYRFDKSTTANLVDQVALTTDYCKSEFVADAIRIGAMFVKIAGADALRSVIKQEETIKQFFEYFSTAFDA